MRAAVTPFDIWYAANVEAALPADLPPQLAKAGKEQAAKVWNAALDAFQIAADEELLGEMGQGEYFLAHHEVRDALHAPEPRSTPIAGNPTWFTGKNRESILNSLRKWLTP